MRLAELRKILRSTDPAAILVPGRVLKRVNQQVNNLPTLLWKVPHSESLVVPRHQLFRHVEQDELDLEPEARLPAVVILLPRPEGAELNETDREATLLRYWRRLFHANVHLKIEERTLTADDVRHRIEKLGLAEFEEIRTVLNQEHFLVPRADDPATYVEFAAVYLELKFFAKYLLPVYFPGIRDFDRVDRLLAEDVDYEALFVKTRLRGAPDPGRDPDTTSDLSHERYWELVREADAANAADNVVRAALLRARAARIAPPALADQTRTNAQTELRHLTRRLQAALQLDEAESAKWLHDLLAILDVAGDQRSPEGGFLYDLQQVCVEHEQEVCAVDPVEWVLSGFKRPIKRPLNAQKPVRILKHLRRAEQRLSMLRLSDNDRHHLSALLLAAVDGCENGLRERFRPIIRDALHDVDLAPTNPPERVAFDKMVEELLDRVISFGYLTFTDLRDVISRNQLKLPDLQDPQQFIRGDPLLRLDRRLSLQMDGIYRPSELYMRLLERLSALNFGTKIGRALTLFLTIPFGAAFLVVESAELVAVKLLNARPMLEEVNYTLVVLAGFFLLALMRLPPFRRRVADFGHVIYQSLYLFFTDVMFRALPLATLRRVVASWPFQLFYWYLLRPFVGCALLWALFPGFFTTVAQVDAGAEPRLRPSFAIIVTVFLAMNFVLNLRAFVVLDEYLLHLFVQFYHDLRAGLLPGLFRLIVRVFKHVNETLEYVMFSVDELLRIHGSDSTMTLVTRGILSVIWYPISYLARFYVIVLVEPCINPIKFPISSVAAKFVYPVVVPYVGVLIHHASTVMGTVLAQVVVGSTVWLSPDFFGFLFWETKENWSLYRANRSNTLRPVPIGSRGETLRGLVRPAFHAGTVPRLFARLRAASVEAARTGNWHTVRTLRGSLADVQRVVRQFGNRDFVSLLLQSTFWAGRSMRVGRVELSFNRIRVEIVNDSFADRPAWIEFEERAGWFIAAIAVKGWMEETTPDQRRALNTALASLYKLAGATLVREQMRAQMARSVASFDVTPDTLILRLDDHADSSLTYDLRGQGDEVKAHSANGTHSKDGFVFRKHRLIFAETSISRDQWIESWKRDQEGKGHPPLSVAGEELVLTE